jgi:hypothetical protein
MKTKPSTEAIIEAFAEELQPLGFSYVADTKWFSRFEGHYEYIFDLGENEKADWVRLLPDVAIRVGPAEAFFSRTSANGQEYSRTCITLGQDFMGLAKARKPMEWIVKDEKSMHHAVKQIMKNFHKLAVPFFERYGNLEELDRALNTRPGSLDYELGGVPTHRASYGLIIAKLLDRPDFDYLADMFDRQLAFVSDGFYLKWFRPLVQDLRENGDLLKQLWNSPPGQGGLVPKYDPAEEPYDPEDDGS